MSRALFVVVVCSLVAAAFAGELCANPEVSAVQTYTSTDLASAREEGVFVSEFGLKCGGEDVKEAQLHAVVNGKVLSVAANEEGDKYQVSWTANHDAAPAGTFNIEFFDDESFGNYNKAHRAGESVEVAPLFKIAVVHPGVSSFDLPVSSQFVALVALLVAFYYANSKRSQL
eukprot:Opistho-2@47019